MEEGLPQIGLDARAASVSAEQMNWPASMLELQVVLGALFRILTSLEASGDEWVVQRVATTLSSHLLPWKNAESTPDKCLTDLWEIPICTLVWPSIAGEISWDVSFVTLNFLVPGLLIVISYSKILQITKASRRRLTTTLASSESHQLRVSQQDVRLFRTLFLLMISFFVMWSPIIVTILLILIQNFEQNLVIWPSLFFWVVAFTFANSAVNPILYNMSLFRNEWRKFFHCFFFSEKGAMFTDTSVRRNDLSVISS
ncbi:free fatty acid receptor 4-like [Globicephala melas]|uniref:free fatty acid receptor 4-like n=1 Tax=Globicephala melas TaxID=9731 RepID=UPI00293D69D6|nr:free fatty acid receptor 4-like [Globicephala melas]